jgi:hypothetical protein
VITRRCEIGMRLRRITLLLALICSLGSLGLGVWISFSRGIPGLFSVHYEDVWAIGIYSGESPLSLAPPAVPSEPVLTSRQVTDVPASSVADPFMVEEDGAWYMFFEVVNAKTQQGDIGLATSQDGMAWTYQQIVLDEPFHLSYPYVFDWKGEYYMIPESARAESIRLYRASVFPAKWVFVADLLTGRSFVDSSIVHFDDTWWLFTSRSGSSDAGYLFFADDLLGPWIEHPLSPIADNPDIARSGGRIAVFDDRLIRYVQDDYPTYGNQVRSFEIVELTRESYKDKLLEPNPVLTASGVGWNSGGMHHIDAHRSEGTWIACVDGHRRQLVFHREF